MCGIVGFYTLERAQLAESRRKWFAQALFANTLRGEDATGVAAINNKDDIRIHKRAMAAPDFLRTKWAQKMIEGNVKLMLGHNRAGTINAAFDDNNAHPFREGKITLVHNGTLSNYYSLRSKAGQDFNVDSHYIAWALDNKTVEEVSEELEGSFSLAWYNSEEESFNLLRNKDRPMYFAVCKHQKTLLFGSEKLLIDWLADRNNIAILGKPLKNPDGSNVLNDKGEPVVSDKPAIWCTTEGYHIKWTDSVDVFEATKVPLHVNKYPVHRSHVNTYQDTTGRKYCPPFKRDPAEPYSFEEEKELFTKAGVHNGSMITFSVLDIREGDGTIEGLPSDLNEYVVHCYQRKHLADFKKLPDKLVRGRVVGARWSKGKAYPIIIVADLTLTNTPDPSFSGEDTISESNELTSDLFLGPDTTLINEAEFNSLTLNGCCVCSESISLTEDVTMGWTLNNDPVCTSCMIKINHSPKGAKATAESLGISLKHKERGMH